MAVVRQTQKVFNRPIGVTRMNTGEAELWQTVSREANGIQSIAFKEGARLAEQFGTEEAKKTSLTAIDPLTKKPEALEIPDGYGSIAQDAYKRVIEKRYTNSIQTEIEEQAASLAIKYPNPNSYDTQMSKYVQQMSESNPEYAGFIEDSGGLYLARTKTSLMKQAHVKARASAAVSISNDFDSTIAKAYQFASSGNLNEAFNLIVEGVDDVSNGEASQVLPAGSVGKSSLSGRTAIAQGLLTHIYSQTSGINGAKYRSAISRYILSSGKTPLLKKYRDQIDVLINGKQTDGVALLDYINAKTVISATEAIASDMSQIESINSSELQKENATRARLYYSRNSEQSDDILNSFKINIHTYLEGAVDGQLSDANASGVIASITEAGSSYTAFKSRLFDLYEDNLLNQGALSLADEARKSMVRELLTIGIAQGEAVAFTAAVNSGNPEDLETLTELQKGLISAYRESDLYDANDAGFVKQVLGQNINTAREALKRQRKSYLIFTGANEFSDYAANAIVQDKELSDQVDIVEKEIGISITSTQAESHISKMRVGVAVGRINNSTFSYNSEQLNSLQLYIMSEGKDAGTTTGLERALGDSVLSVLKGDNDKRVIKSHIGGLRVTVAEEERRTAAKLEATKVTDLVANGLGSSAEITHRNAQSKRFRLSGVNLTDPSSLNNSDVLKAMSETVPQTFVNSLKSIVNLQDVDGANVLLQHYARLSAFRSIEDFDTESLDDDTIIVTNRIAEALSKDQRDDLDVMISMIGRDGASLEDVRSLLTLRDSESSNETLRSIFPDGHKAFVLSEVSSNIYVAQQLYNVVEKMARVGVPKGQIEEYIESRVENTFHESDFIHDANFPIGKANKTEFSLENILKKSSNARFEDEKKELITIINESLGDGFSLNKTKKAYETTASIDLVKYLGGYGRKELPKGYKDLNDLIQKAEQEKEDIKNKTEAEIPVYLVPHKYSGTDQPLFFAHVVSEGGELVPHIIKINDQPFWPSFNADQELVDYRKRLVEEQALADDQDKVNLIEQDAKIQAELREDNKSLAAYQAEMTTLGFTDLREFQQFKANEKLKRLRGQE